MYDPSENSNIGEEYMLDEQERQRQLSNEQIQAIQERIEASQEVPTEPEQQVQQAVTAVNPELIETESQPTGEQEQENLSPEEYLSGMGYDPATVMQRMSAPGQGLVDTTTDAINLILSKTGIKIPKVSKYEDGVAEATRKISSVVLPMYLTQGVFGAAARGLQSQAVSKFGANALINRLGNTAFMRFIGNRGVEAAAGASVGIVSSEYETGDNLSGMLKKALPAQWDFIPDSWATLDTDGPDEKRQKSINEDLALGFLIPFARFARKFSAAVDETKQVFRGAPVIRGETDQAVKYLADNRPAPASEVPEEALLEYAARQEEALDELGYYNLNQTTDPNVPLNGVHDLYDFRETATRTVDDFGIIGASVDAARIQTNKGTVNGRLGNFISGPALKYGVDTPGGVEEITIGLTQQLREADRVGMIADDFTVTSDEVIQAGDNLILELFDPNASIDDMRRMLEPSITTNEFGVEILNQDGYTDALSSINTLVKEYQGMDVARAQAYTATSMAGQISDLAEGIRLDRGSLSVENAQEQILDKINFLQQLVASTRYFTIQKRGIAAIG